MKLRSVFSSKIKYIRIRATRQGWISCDPKPLEEVVSNPVEFFSKFTRAELEVLNYLLVWSNSYKSMYFTQSTIAQGIGYSRRHVNSALALFEAAGVIASNYRHKTSNLYKISSWFNDLNLRESLRSFFRAFVWFPIALLTPDITGSVTQERYHLSYNNHVYNSLTSLAEDLAAMLKVNDKPNPISQAIRDIKGLPLSRWGQIKLCAFPDAAINYAANQLQYAKQVPDKFRWFFSLCQQWCDANNIRPNYQKSDLLAKNYKMPDYANMLLSEKNVKATNVMRSFAEILRDPKDQPQVNYYGRRNYEHAQKEKKHYEKVAREKDMIKLQNMSLQEAEFEYQKRAAVHPDFGPPAAKAFMKLYYEAQDKKNKSV